MRSSFLSFRILDMILAMPTTSRTLAQKTNASGWPKPAEIIEITGMSALEASDRVVINVLGQHAHDSGRMGEAGARWEIPLADLRTSRDDNNRVRESLRRILAVTVEVRYFDADMQANAVLQTHLFQSFITPQADAGTAQILRFGIPDELRAVLARSSRWGRIKAEIVCAMSSKYSIALYEMLALREHMHRGVETFDVARFRALLGIPDNAYSRGNDLQRLLEIAVAEINGLSDIGVKIEINRRKAKPSQSKTSSVVRAPITSITMAWWTQDGDAYRAAVVERSRSKVGRMARLMGKVELPAGQIADTSSVLRSTENQN
jgi:nucleoside 2-deoxyribosyltransferase